MGERREGHSAAPPRGGIPAPSPGRLAPAELMELGGLGGFTWNPGSVRAHLDHWARRVLGPSATAEDGAEEGDEDGGDPAALLARLLAAEADRTGSALARALKDGQGPFSAHFRVPLPDGSPGWTSARGRVVRSGPVPGGAQVVGVVGDATDTFAEAARLLREEPGQGGDAEKDADKDGDGGRQSDLVMEVTATLSEAVTVRDVTVALVGNKKMGRLGIVSLFLGLVEGDRIHVVAEGQDGSFVPVLEYTRIEDDFPMSEVVRTLRPRFVTSAEEFARRYPRLWPHIGALEMTAAAYLPLIAQGRAIGALGFIYRRKHYFTVQERDLLIALSGSIAQSLQRAMLFDQEHDIAQSLQTAMLPRRIPRIPGAQVAVRYRTAKRARDIGGDWYDVVPLPGGRVAAVIGDVQGHDTHAAAVMGQLRIALRAYAAEGHQPATVMARASSFLYELDTDRFATCLYAEIDPAGGTVSVVRAGHLDPLVRAADGSCRPVAVDGGLPLGLSAHLDDAGYRVTTIELGLGETLLMFTDGLVERPGSDLDDGLRRLGDALRDGPDDIGDLADHITQSVPASDTYDDMALLLLRRDGDGATTSGPDAVDRLHHHIAPGDARALATARAAARRAAAAWGLPERADDAEVAVGELVTNALVHTEAGAVLSLRLLTSPVRRLRVEVHDTAADWPRRRDAGPDDPSGRGLLLVDRLADAWGVERHGGGKSVWCEFRV